MLPSKKRQNDRLRLLRLALLLQRDAGGGGAPQELAVAERHPPPQLRLLKHGDLLRSLLGLTGVNHGRFCRVLPKSVPSALMRSDRMAYGMAHGGDEAMMNGWDEADWIWMTFMMIAFWGGLAAVVAFAIKGFGGSRRSSETQTPNARTVLETRFAKGDISEEEFEDRRKALGPVGELNRQDDRKVAGAR